MGNTRFILRNTSNRAVLSVPSFYANVPGCTFFAGSSTISRSSGSFVDDGIRIGDAVASASAGIPAGAVVADVTAGSLSIDQPITGTAAGVVVRFGTLKTPRVVNGNSLYTSTPDGVVIVAPDSNIQNVVDPDRYVGLVVPAGVANDGTDVSVDVDLGADVPLVGVGFSNVDLPGPLTFPTTLLVWGKAASGGYPASFSASAWTAGQWSVGGIGIGGGANPYFALPAPVAARYLRYKFLNASFSTAQWSMGFPIAASTSIVDIGVTSNPGTEIERRKNVASVRSWSGIPTTTDLGGDYSLITLKLRITGAQLAQLLPIVTNGKPFLYVDENDKVLECVTSEQRFKYTRIWTDLYDVELEMESLP